jgi:hypothetical protein
MNAYKWDFFIAHASADKASAESLYEFIVPHARVFLDSRCLMLGDDWDRKLAEAQKSALVTVVLISSYTEQAYYQREEIAAAIALARQNEEAHRVVPVYLDDVAASSDVVPYGLRLKQGLTLSDDIRLDGVAESLLNLLQQLRGSTGVRSQRAWRGDKPSEPLRFNPLDDVSFSISVIGSEDEPWSSRDTVLSYSLHRSDGEIHIEPSMPYLSTFLNGGPIEPIAYNWVPFQWDFPNLDFKLVNNSKRTLFFTEAIFHVVESRLDRLPVLVVEPDTYRGNALHLSVSNQGWGEVHDLIVKFNLIPLGSERRQEADFSGPYSHEVNVGTFLESINISIADAFRAAGANLDGLASLKVVSMTYGGNMSEVTMLDKEGKEVTITGDAFVSRRSACFGPFQKGGALVVGELGFDALTNDGSTEHKRVKFTTVVWLFDEPLEGAPAPPTYQYATKFAVDCRDYERRVSISHVIKPGDADRFNIKIGMDKSSVHRFRISLANNDGSEIESPVIYLHGFVPRAGAEYVNEEVAPRFNE